MTLRRHASPRILDPDPARIFHRDSDTNELLEGPHTGPNRKERRERLKLDRLVFEWPRLRRALLAQRLSARVRRTRRRKFRQG